MLQVRRTGQHLLPDPRRVIAKPYLPGEEIGPSGDSRARLLLERILMIPDAQVATVLADVLASFSTRHRDFEHLLQRHFDLAAHLLGFAAPISPERRLLIGAYFTHEYSVEAAALFNPSIVLHPDQRQLGPGQSRFVMSLRAVGEGHISSIEFRSGIIDSTGALALDLPGHRLVTGKHAPPDGYDRRQFFAKLTELGAANEIAVSVLAGLGDRFTLTELDRSLGRLEREGLPHAIHYETAKMIRMLASSSYVTSFPADSALSERVIFPAGPNETHGMEDARFVRFIEDDGSIRYYATYTAFDGFEILPQLIETEDFVSFAVSTLNGSAAQNKGMALFPRRIGGRYVMLSRKDRENLHIATSNDVRLWDNVEALYQPTQPWELLQIGNCGSPLETDAGWLVLTHGVGPMRRYAIGALLLDLDHPSRVLGHLADPLLVPDQSEREGYVPNVLYSCGGLIHGDQLVLPYGISDRGVGIALVSLPDLLAELKRG